MIVARTIETVLAVLTLWILVGEIIIPLVLGHVPFPTFQPEGYLRSRIRKLNQRLRERTLKRQGDMIERNIKNK